MRTVPAAALPVVAVALGVAAADTLVGAAEAAGTVVDEGAFVGAGVSVALMLPPQAASNAAPTPAATPARSRRRESTRVGACGGECDWSRSFIGMSPLYA
jgi:hypothetical protein